MTLNMKFMNVGHVLLLCSLAHSVSFVRGCEDVAARIIEYRDALFSDSPGFFSYSSNDIRQQIMTFGIDINNDEDILTFACKLTESTLSPPQTIGDLLAYLVEGGLYFAPEEDNPVKIALYYAKGMEAINWALTDLTRRAEEADNTISLYNWLGVPDFPLALNESEIDSIVRSFPEEFLGNLFSGIVEYGETPEGARGASYKVSLLVTALAKAHSVRDFADTMEQRCWRAEDCFPRPRPGLFKVTKHVLEDIVGDLKSVGWWNLKRSEHPLECPDVVEDIMEALQLALQLVKSDLRGYIDDALRSLGILSISQHPQKLNKWICQIVESKSQSELFGLIPGSPPYFKENYYYYMARSVIEPLLNPGRHLRGISRLLKQAASLQKTGFPDFPLNISPDDVRRVAQILANDNPWMKGDLIEAFSNATSKSDAQSMMGHSTFMMFESIVENLGTQERRSQLEHLSFLAFGILARLEEGGLFMLPE